MGKINLRGDETLLLKSDRVVMQHSDKDNENVHLVLTDKNLYLEFPSIWTGKIIDTKCIPLSSVTTFDGKAQVFVRSMLGFQHFLVITTKEEAYEFYMAMAGKAEVQRWADCIASSVTKAKDVYNASADSAFHTENASSEFEISYDVMADTNIKDETADIELHSDKKAEKKRGFWGDAFSNTKDKLYETNGYVIKFETDMYHNSWDVYDNEGKRIYKVKRELVALRPCIKIYDYQKKQYVAEIKRQINPMPHIHESYVWIAYGKTLGIVTMKYTRKPFKFTYTADFLGWVYNAGFTKCYEIMYGNKVVAKPLTTKGANPEPYEYYDARNELGVIMMFYTHYLDIHDERASLKDRMLYG